MLKLATIGVAYCVSAFFITFTNSNVITNRNIVPAIHSHPIIKHDNPLWANSTILAPVGDRKLRLYKIYKKIKKLNPLKKKKALKFIAKNLPKLLNTIQPTKKAYIKYLKRCVPIEFLKELAKAGSTDEEYNDYLEDDYLEDSGSRHDSTYRPPLALPPIPIFHQRRRILLDSSKPKQPDKHKESPLFIVLAKLLQSSSIQSKEKGIVVKQLISNVRNKPMTVMTPTAVKLTHMTRGGLIIPYQYSKRAIPVKEKQNDVMVIRGPYPNLTRVGVVKNRIILPPIVLFKPDGANTVTFKPTFHISYGKNYYDLSKKNRTTELIRFGIDDTMKSEIINNNKLPPEGNVLPQNFSIDYYSKYMPTDLNRITYNKEQTTQTQLIFGPTTVTERYTENKSLFGGAITESIEKAQRFYPAEFHNLKQNYGFPAFLNNMDRQPHDSFEIYSTTESHFPKHAYFVTPQTESDVFLPIQIPERTAYINQHFSLGNTYQNQENEEILTNNSNKPFKNINLTNLSHDIYKIILLPTPIPEVQHPKSIENKTSLTSLKKLFYPNINSSFDLPTNSLRNNMEFINVDKNRINILKKLAAKINENKRNAGKVSIPKVILPPSISTLMDNNNFMYTSSYNPSDRFRIGKEMELQNVTTENYYGATENEKLGGVIDFFDITPAPSVYNATENINEMVDSSVNISTFSTEYSNREQVNETDPNSTTSNTVKLYSVTENVVEIEKS